MVIVTEAALDAYEAERLEQLERLAKAAPAGAAFHWTPLVLNEDGSEAPQLPATKPNDSGPTSSRGDWKS